MGFCGVSVAFVGSLLSHNRCILCFYAPLICVYAYDGSHKFATTEAEMRGSLTCTMYQHEL